MDTRTHRARLSAVSLGILGLLSACGGGGTSAPLLQRATPTDDLSTTGYVNPHRVTLSTDHQGAAVVPVRVGVVDTGFDTAHFELSGRVAAAQEFAGTGTLVDNVAPHGTRVAMVLAGRHVGHSGNTHLLLAKAADASGFIGTGTVSHAAQWALTQGAQVLNFSIGPLYRHYGATSDALFGQAVQRDAVVVMVAGNDAANLSTQTQSFASLFDPGREAYRQVSLVVGATRGNQLASYSNHPGENATLQARFLVAEGRQAVQPAGADAPAATAAGLAAFNGTSAAAPVVSAAAASVRAYWPHLSAAATTQLLLDTADRSFSPLYQLNHCGSSGNVNCGHYTFGQGRLDLARALLPVGLTYLPSGVVLQGPSQPVAATHLLLPAAFGDALAGRSVTAALFDRYQRDFRFNLLQRVDVAAGTPLLDAAALAPDPDGSVSSGPLAFDGGRWSAQLQHTRGDRLDDSAAPMPLVSLRGSGPLGRYGLVHGLRLQAPLGERATLHWSARHAQGVSSTGGAPSPHALRQEAGLQWRLGRDTRWGLGYALTRERHALMGGSGSAGLGLGGVVHHAAVVQWQHEPRPGVTWFGRAEFGALQVRGTGLLTHIDAARTTQWSTGLAWRQGRGQWGLALSQPVRVERARAHFDVPLGRTPEGAVLRGRSSLDLAPSGRQVNLELGWRHQPDEHTVWGFNAVWARDHGHVAGQREWALGAHWHKRW